MYKWKTEEVVQIIKNSICKTAMVYSTDCGGDYDGTNIFVKTENGHPFYICPFPDDLRNTLVNKDDFEAVYIELNDGMGGTSPCVSSNVKDHYVCAELTCLFQNLGLSVIRTHEEIF